MTETCPRIEALSARLDDALSDPERDRLDAHLRACPACGEAFSTMRALQGGMRRLPEPRLGVDLSGVIDGRIAGIPLPQSKPRRRGFSPLAPPLPMGAALAASLALGLALGFGLSSGGGMTVVPRVAAMAVFDAIAPGGVCIGLEACYRSGSVE